MSVNSELDRFLTELKRRRVYRVAAIYAAAGFALLQALDIVLPALSAPAWILRVCVIGVLIGFPVALALAWIFDVTPEGVERTDDLPEGTPTHLPRTTRVVRVVAGLVLVGAVLAGAGVWFRPGEVEGTVVAGADVIAVLPFRATGPDVGSLSEGMVDLLSTNLDQVGAIRTVPPRRVLQAWDSRPDGADGTGVDGLAIGRELGAGSVLSGSVTQAGPEARLVAALSTTNGDELARATVTGPSDQVLALVDSLSLALLREVWRSREPIPSFDVSRITTSSLDAVRSYLRGEAAYRRSAWTEAIAEYEEAVRFDSTFALAHVRLGSSYGWNEQLLAPAAREHVAAALRFVDRLPERHRQLVVATGLWYEDDRSAAVDTLTAYVERFPDDPDGWFLLGDLEFHRPDAFLIPVEHFYPPFERVLELDPTLTPALFHPIDLALGAADSARFRAYLGQMEAASGNQPVIELLRRAAELTWPADGMPATRAELAELASMTFERRPSMFASLTGAAFYSPSGAPNEFVDGLLSLEATFRANPQSGPMLSLAAAPLLMVLGRFEEAGAWLDEAQRYQPTLNAMLSVSAVTAGLRDDVDPAVEAEFAGMGNGSVLRATVALARGDTDVARAQFEQLPDDPRTRATLGGWADLIDGDTARGIARLREGIASVDSIGGFALVSFEALRYRLLDAEARRPETRDQALDRLLTRRWVDLNYVALSHLTAGEVAEALGDRTGAATHYERFLQILGRADPVAEPLLARGRAGLARVAN